MDEPVNASYQKNKVPENPGEKFKVLGMVFHKNDMWKVGLVIGAVLVLTIVFIIFMMPSGISFLAAKNANGLLGYMMLFIGYMFGYVFIIMGFLAAVVGILYAIQTYA